MTIRCYAAPSKGALLEKHQYDPKPLGERDVHIEISHCGICHSDLHLIDNDWGNDSYPLIPGHEVIGFVREKGSLVTELELGDRVGVGWLSGSCMQCEWCHQGEENLCAGQEATCVGRPGGFAEAIRCESRFAFKIPDALPSEQAAPLLCGGITVFSPLLTYNVQPTTKVGVIGIGGLGHLALQFMRAFGCQVTAFSHSADKEEEAKRLGADAFIPSCDPKALAAVANSFDLILCTVSQSLDWNAYLNCLRPKGVLCCVGVQAQLMKIPFFSLLVGRKTLSGSNIGSCPEIHKMLTVAAHHNIRAEIQLYPMSEVNQAIEDLRAGKMRYRAVLYN